MIISRTCFLFLGLSLTLSGCAGDASVPQEQLDRARQALQTALDAWKQGVRADTLQAQAIEMSDPDWNAGLRLLDYQLQRTEGKLGQNVRSWAALSLQDRQGKKTQREAVFEIRLQDKIVIGRDPMN